MQQKSCAAHSISFGLWPLSQGSEGVVAAWLCMELQGRAASSSCQIVCVLARCVLGKLCCVLLVLVVPELSFRGGLCNTLDFFFCRVFGMMGKPSYC